MPVSFFILCEAPAPSGLGNLIGGPPSPRGEQCWREGKARLASTAMCRFTRLLVAIQLRTHTELMAGRVVRLGYSPNCVELSNVLFKCRQFTSAVRAQREHAVVDSGPEMLRRKLETSARF